MTRLLTAVELLPVFQFLHRATIAWHGVRLGQPDWSPQSRSVAFGAELKRAGIGLHFIVNAYREGLDFGMPPAIINGDPWRRWIDTLLQSPHDIVEWHKSRPAANQQSYRAGPRSVVALFRRPD